MNYRVLQSVRQIPVAMIALACATAMALDDQIEEPGEVQLGGEIRFAKDATFDDWAFLGKPDRRKTEIDALFRQRVVEIRLKFSLDLSHQAKLKLAAQGDIQRYHDQVENLRRRFDETMKDNNDSGLHSATSEWSIVRNEAEQLRTRHRTLFDRDSLVWKVASKLKTDEDIKRRRLSISLVIREIAGSADLQSEQQQAIAQRLTQELRTTKVHQNYDAVLVGYKCSQLPSDTLRPLFNDDQWPHVQEVLTSYQQHRELLVRQRLIPAETVAIAQTGIPVRSKYQRRNGPASALFPDNSVAPSITVKQDSQ